MAGPLDGITVLDLSTVGPATRCSRLLADYGARVVKVVAPRFELAFHAYSGHRGMQRAAIDLRSEGGRSAFLRLATGAGVVLESFRPGVVDRLGVGYEAVKAVNPSVVYCSTTGYGQGSQRAGHDLNYLAAGGFLHTTERVTPDVLGGTPGTGGSGQPALPGATVADIAAGGMHAAVAILAALVKGEGAYLDVSVTDGVAWMMSLYIDEYLATGDMPGPGHSILTGRYACYGIYGTRDGKWLAVGAIEPAFWANLCRALGLERWIDRQNDDAAQNAIRADLAAAFAARDRDDWVAELADADTCVSPVLDIPEVAAAVDTVEAKDPEHGTFRQLGPVLAGSPRQAVYELPVVDTEAVLAEAGFTQDEIDRLHNEGAIA
jgi:alpha-methylacyl-CoA racemase